ncbi:MAG: DUF3987 domain-containing protein [Phycisphaerae bacterium]|nr:DUF3987 domain-containing protein [Phycisphaerae bacterium]
MKCHAGCSAEAIVKALGLTMRDLMPPRVSPSPKPAPPRDSSRNGDAHAPKVFKAAAEAVAELERRHGPRSAQWVYQDADGNPIGMVVRWNRPGDQKDIRPVSRTPEGWIIGGMTRPKPLYQLPTLANASRVYVCEGELAVDAVISLGLIATTSSNGSKSANQTDWTLLAGRAVVILPDADEAGEQYAADVAAILAKLNPPAAVRIMRTSHSKINGTDMPYMDLPPKGDIADWVERYRKGGHNEDAMREDLETLVVQATMTPTPPAPVAELFQPFPVDALPDRLRVFVEAVAAATGTAPAFAAIAVLVVVAGSIGNRVAVLVKPGWTEPAVLWGVLVGRSGTTKSPVLKLVTRALIELFKAERRAYRDALKEYQREFERHGVRLTEWKKAQRNGPPTDPPDEPECPTERRLVVSDVTIEKLGCLLEENPLGLLLVRDELAAWVGAFDRYASGGKGSDQPAWLSMYDAAPVTIDRKSGKGTYFVERATVSVLGSIQPGTLSRSFGIAEREAGLLARVLVAYPPDRPALWIDAAMPDDVAGAWHDLLAALLALPAGVDDLGDPRPRFIPIGKEAKPLWVEWHDRHVLELVDIGDDDLGAHYAKLKGACARIALLFACVEVAVGGNAIAHISADAMRRAIAVTEWFKSEAQRVYAVLGESEEERERRKLIEWIEHHGGNVTVRDLTHSLHQYRGRADAAKAELDALAKVGFGSWTHPAPGPKGGRPSSRFVLNRADPVTKTLADDAANRGFGCGDGGYVPAELSPGGAAPEDVDGYSPNAAGDAVSGDDGEWGEV